MKDNILIVIGFASILFLWSCSSANGQTITEEFDCATEQLNLSELERRLKTETPYWQYEMNLLDRDSVKKAIEMNCKEIL